jgi:hypothetical protein
MCIETTGKSDAVPELVALQEARERGSGLLSIMPAGHSVASPGERDALTVFLDLVLPGCSLSTRLFETLPYPYLDHGLPRDTQTSRLFVE